MSKMEDFHHPIDRSLSSTAAESTTATYLLNDAVGIPPKGTSQDSMRRLTEEGILPDISNFLNFNPLKRKSTSVSDSMPGCKPAIWARPDFEFGGDNRLILIVPAHGCNTHAIGQSRSQQQQETDPINQIGHPRGQHGPTPNLDALSEAVKIENMITTGDAGNLQRELMANGSNSQVMLDALRIVHEDMKSQGIDVTTIVKNGRPTVFVESENGRISVEFNDPFSVGNVPIVGTHLGHFREYHQSGQPSDASQGLRNVLTEAELNQPGPPR